MSDSADESRIFISTLRPSLRQERLALMAVAVSAILFVAILPYARVQLPAIWPFIPVYESAIVINDLVTAALLLGQFNILRSPALLVLSGGYLFTAFMAAAHMLSFPGLFTASGLLGAGTQTTAWLYMFWHGGFPLAVLGYAILRGVERTRPFQFAHSAGPILLCTVSALLATGGLVLLASAGQASLPRIMQGQQYAEGMPGTVGAVWLLNLTALLVLWWRRQPRSVLHVWLMVVNAAWVFDVALSAVFNHARFDLGFYAGRAYGLLASTFVLVALMFEHAKLYASVVRALDGERTEREHVQEKTEQLNEANERLERRVAARTSELVAINEALRLEIAERERIEQALEQSRAELCNLAAINSTAREQEKRRIARELHDELAQSLAALKIDLEIMEKRVLAGDKVSEQRMNAMVAMLEETIAATRRIASDLRPAMLDDLGLVPACKWLLHRFQRRHAIQCEWVVDPADFELAEPYASTVFRVLQECLINISRHAQASRVRVELACLASQVTLSVRDNGNGFDVSTPRKADSFGLVGLRERAYLVQGQLRIESARGAGTIIELTIPLPPLQCDNGP